MKVDVPASRNKKSFQQQPNSALQWAEKEQMNAVVEVSRGSK